MWIIFTLQLCPTQSLTYARGCLSEWEEEEAEDGKDQKHLSIWINVGKGKRQVKGKMYKEPPSNANLTHEKVHRVSQGHAYLELHYLKGEGWGFDCRMKSPRHGSTWYGEDERWNG